MYQVYIVTKEDAILLPIAPSYINIKINDKDKRIDLANKGEVNILKSPGLTDIEFDIRLFKNEVPFAQYLDGFKEPGYYIEKLTKIKANKEYCRLIINRTMPGAELFDTDMLVSIKDMDIPEEAKEGSGDFYIKTTFKQYKPLENDILELKQVGDKKVLVRNNKQRPSKEPPYEILVKEGQTLWIIAKNKLNDETKVSEIMRLNNLKNPNDIKVGQKLRLR